MSWDKDFDRDKLEEMINRRIRIEKDRDQGCEDAHVHHRKIQPQ